MMKGQKGATGGAVMSCKGGAAARFGFDCKPPVKLSLSAFSASTSSWPQLHGNAASGKSGSDDADTQCSFGGTMCDVTRRETT